MSIYPTPPTTFMSILMRLPLRHGRFNTSGHTPSTGLYLFHMFPSYHNITSVSDTI